MRIPPITSRQVRARQSGVVDVTIDDVSQQGEVVSVTITAEGPPTNTPFDLDVTIDVQGLDTIGSESVAYAIEPNNQTITRTVDIEIGGPSEGEELAATIEAVATDPNDDTRSDSVSETLTNPTFAAEVTIENCGVRTSDDGDMLVDLETTTSTGELVERDVEVRVDGSPVQTETRNWPDGSTTTLSVPSRDLPTGDDMPVEVGIGGNFSDCGTVTVEDGEPSRLLAAIGDCAVETRNGAITAEVEVTPDGGTMGEVSVYLYGNGEQLTDPKTTDVPQTGSSVSFGPIDVEPGDYTVTTELVAGSGREQVSGGEVECGTVTVGERGSGGGNGGVCDVVSEEHRQFLAEYGTPGEPVDGDLVDQAFGLWQEGELSAETLRAVQQGFNSGCTVPENGNGGGGTARNLAIGAAVVGLGYAASRLLD